MSQMLNVFGKNLPQLVQCFHEGGGIPYTEFQGFAQSMADVWRRIYDEHLIGGFLPAAHGLPSGSALESASRTSAVVPGTPSM